MTKIITKITGLPDRIQGKGDRADIYSIYLNQCKIAILNDEDFNTVVDHNTKRQVGEDAKAIYIDNNEDDTAYLILKQSALDKQKNCDHTKTSLHMMFGDYVNLCDDCGKEIE